MVVQDAIRIQRPNLKPVLNVLVVEQAGRQLRNNKGLLQAEDALERY